MLFDAFEETVSPGEYTPSLPEVKEWTLTEKLRREKSVLGFYWSGHPLDRFKEVLDKFINITTEQAEFNPEKVPANIAIAGIVAEISRKTSRRGDPFVIVKLEDLTGRFEIRLFRNEKNSFFENIEEGKEYFILGKKDTYENGKENMLRVLPKKMLHFDQLSEHLSGDYFLKIPEKIFTNEFSHRLLSTLKAHPGKFGVHITVESAKYNVLNLHPRSLRVFPSVEVIKLLNGLDGVNQRINLNFN